MNALPSRCLSDNRKSAIQNLKLVEFLTILAPFAWRVADGPGAAAEESPSDRYLSAGDPTNESARAEAIRLALRELGYIEGQNIAIEYRYAEGKFDRLPELAAELVRLKVDIIVAAGGTAVVRAAKNATRTIPIVMLGPGSILSRQA